MYKLLIVDDEKEIRDGLAAWPWESIGIQAAGCSTYELEALQFLPEHPADIVITDIRMPFMVLLTFFVGHRYLVEGIVTTGVKG